jgi:hypothetical protein
MNKLKLLSLTLPLALLAACGGGGSSDKKDPAPAFSITTSALTTGIVGVPYTHQLNTANGAAPATFAWDSAFTPPAWLNLSASGLLTGTPAAVTSLNLQIVATDAASATASRTLALNVIATPQIDAATLPRAIKGQVYAQQQLNHDAPVGLAVTFGLAATSPAFPSGMGISPGGLISGTPALGGLFVLEIELRYSGSVLDTSILDLVVYESIPYTYIEDALEPNDTRGTGTQLFPTNTPAGRMTMADVHVQADPLTLNSDLNITKPDPDDYFRFNTGTTGEIRIEVFFRGLVGEVDAYLWYYTGPPTHAVVVVAESVSAMADDELIVYPNAPAGFYYLQIHAPGDATASLYNRNAYTFRVSFNDLTITTDRLEADAASGPIDEQLSALNQGTAPGAPVWSLVNGTLPTGVSFTTDGRFTGTPTEFGVSEFTVQVEDGGITAERMVRVRFFDSSVGDYWQIQGERRMDTGAIFEAWGDCMVVAPHPDYPTTGAIYVLGGYSSAMLDAVRVFHTSGAKQNTFEDIGANLPVPVRYHRAVFLQHSYGGYIYVVGGEVGNATGHTFGDLWRGVYRLQVSDAAGTALAHPLGAWELLSELPAVESTGHAILGWAEFGLAQVDAAADADDRIYLLGGRYDLENTVGSGTYTRTFHDAVLMFEPPATAGGSGTWTRKIDSAPYTPRRFPAVAMVNGDIFVVAGREGVAGQSGSGSTIADYIEMYRPDPSGANAAVATSPRTSFPTLTGGGGYYPMYANINGSLYVWCGWNSNFEGTKALNRFDPGTNTVTRLMDADWGTGFGGGVAHDGKLWIISGIGHLVGDEPLNLVYYP